MIPYIHIPDLTLVHGEHKLPLVPWHIGPLALHPFGLLVATGVIVGTWLATYRAKKIGVDLELLNSFITWMLVAGFIGGHMLDEIFYHWHDVVERPLSLFFLWEGLSSFGGFTGGLIGVLLWKNFEALPNGGFARRKVARPILPFCDIILSVFPVAWIFGRSGCSSVHDHPGALLSSVHDKGWAAQLDQLLAVAYPEPRLESVPADHFALFHGHAPRFDLGLLEMMFTCILALCFALTWNKRLPTGMYVAVVSLAYAPVRFAMDFLRIMPDEDPRNADPRYGFGAIQLTPAQWECVALFALGIGMLFYIRSLKRRGVDPMNDVLAAPASAKDDGAGFGGSLSERAS